jgi:hypothetical protein
LKIFPAPFLSALGEVGNCAIVDGSAMIGKWGGRSPGGTASISPQFIRGAFRPNLSVQQLQTITQQNESLRQENAKLKQQLSFPKTRNGFGILKGKVAIADDFDAPLDEFADYQ